MSFPAELSATYEPEELIGSGATGMVWAARRRADGRSVAIKTLKPELAFHPELALRLREEAEVGRRVSHPGIARTLEAGELAQGSPYVVFERIAGASLLELLHYAGRLSVGEAMLIARRVANVLAGVHGAGYVHRDVKPEHILLGVSGGRSTLHLIDFGVCQAREPLCPISLVRERGRVFGTPGYLSPEQALADGPVDARSDLYGLGATLFEMLTGERPFAAENVARLLCRVLSEEPPELSRLRPDAPPLLARLLRQLLARDPAERPESARAVARKLLAPAVHEGRAETALQARLSRLPSHGAALSGAPTSAPVLPAQA